MNIDIAAARALCEGAVALTCATRDDNTEHKLALARIDRLRAIEAFLPAALDEIERLRRLAGGHGFACVECNHLRASLTHEQSEIDALTADLAAMTAARDSACDLVEQVHDGSPYAASSLVAPLRAVGSVTK